MVPGRMEEGTGPVNTAGKCHRGKAALHKNCLARDGRPPADVSYMVKRKKTLISEEPLSKAAPMHQAFLLLE